MSEKKRYGRQIFISFIVTIVILLGGVYLATQYLLPHVKWDQDQLFSFFVKLFPLLIGLIMIEIGVVISKKRDEDFADDIDKLPPNAYDRPFYALPQDDPAFIRNDEVIYAQAPVLEEATFSEAVLSEEPIVERAAEVILPLDLPQVEEEPEVLVVEPVAETVATELEEPILETVAAEEKEPVVGEAAPVVPPYQAPRDEISIAIEEGILQVYEMDFDSILELELESANDLNYDLTVVIVRVTEGPVDAIAQKLIRQSGDLSYTFTLEDNTIGIILPFYNGEEARTFTLSLIESCQQEFQGSELEIGFASRGGRVVEKDEITQEAYKAASF
ncbi:MAG TPA: hypothetical protein PLF67_03895 [Sphaerochaeta sp.]|nr:hypothetical protein [Sphaerochaeta sp.]